MDNVVSSRRRAVVVMPPAINSDDPLRDARRLHALHEALVVPQPLAPSLREQAVEDTPGAAPEHVVGGDSELLLRGVDLRAILVVSEPASHERGGADAR